MSRILDRLFGKKVSKDDSAFEAQEHLVGSAGKLTIFDAGAYVGDVALQYKKTFPLSTIHCFEPFPDSFGKLSQLCRDQSIVAHQVALSDTDGKATFRVDTDATCNSLYPRPEEGFKYYPNGSKNVGQIEVPTCTLDSFCQREGIATIDILKVDVEGAEVRMLKGAAQKLAGRQIKLIYTEVMFTKHYEGGCLFYEVCDVLNQYGYSLFNLYNLKRARNGQLRWGNAIFLSPETRARAEATSDVQPARGSHT